MTRDGEGGQAAVLLLGALIALLAGAVLLGGVARGIGAHADRQQAADLAALAAAKAMHDAYPRVFAPGARHLDRAAYLRLGADAARDTARRNGMERIDVTFPGGGLAPVHVRVAVGDPIRVGSRRVGGAAVAEAELLLDGTTGAEPVGTGEYTGPLAMRQGHGMRPDVARAFDRMAAAAHADGIDLVINSAFRSNAEQAALFAARSDPKWVAPPGRSLHRLGTELDLGPPGAYRWLAANAGRFGFRRRYSWEPWHFGYTRSPGSRSVGYGNRADGAASRTLPAFVPAAYAPPLARAAQRWGVGAALLAAQLYQESGFDPFARSGAGALGIAQFMPDTAATYGLRDPFDAARAIDAQGHLMHDLLAQFGEVPLALAAYNAGARRVAECMCIPPIAETQAYVANILALLAGAGDPVAATGLTIRLVA